MAPREIITYSTERKPSTCATNLVFFAGLQKAGTTSFQALTRALGYASYKVPWLPSGILSYSRDEMLSFVTEGERAFHMGVLGQFNATNPFATLGPSVPTHLALSDFPIFGVACALAHAHPNAKFVLATRKFESWIRSQSADVLCDWMGRYSRCNRASAAPFDHDAPGSTVCTRSARHDVQCRLGYDFMRFFWKQPFDDFCEAISAGEPLCTDLRDPGWAPIHAAMRTRVKAHERQVRCPRGHRCCRGRGATARAHVAGARVCDPRTAPHLRPIRALRRHRREDPRLPRLRRRAGALPALERTAGPAAGAPRADAFRERIRTAARGHSSSP